MDVVGCGFHQDLLNKLRIERGVRSAATNDGRLVLELNEGAKMAPLVRLIVESGAEVEEVRKAQISLEDVFLALIQEDHDGQ